MKLQSSCWPGHVFEGLIETGLPTSKLIHLAVSRRLQFLLMGDSWWDSQDMASLSKWSKWCERGRDLVVISIRSGKPSLSQYRPWCSVGGATQGGEARRWRPWGAILEAPTIATSLAKVLVAASCLWLNSHCLDLTYSSVMFFICTYSLFTPQFSYWEVLLRKKYLPF